MYNSKDQLSDSGSTLGYDFNGNLTSYSGFTLGYDINDKLATLSSGATTMTYGYRSDGLRA
jgi:hypothetical protein